MTVYKTFKGNGSVVGGMFETFSGAIKGGGSYTNMPNPQKTGYEGFSGFQLDLGLGNVRNGSTTRGKRKGVKYIIKVL